ncbi:MAG: RloB domain-containing protein [Candidatus Aminicenantes bacterium]|nr:RloB domain-containing protein [Candidatus Aminicenantes bacterium]NIM81965.1 RloB domain-containing protein [Candidatus Aminicenantes bacterium]NIN21353.1 RloB domain-containing protein [Candidatus Aminicenantes bacterium]NIN45174.1 RloB domain-containing protein [Candidatus Aminicenantes bacterium]NIN87991.1 RloB domain-containing protein [Candidatus Aminicenantes bacterium]
MTQQGRRRFKPLSRPTAYRDAQLIIIATEDTKAEPKYFRDVAAYYKNPKVHVEVLTRPTTASSPEYVISMLDKFKRNYHLSSSDELWMVIDVDRWGEKKLSIIAMQCRQKNYFLAVSNPSSDLWFLLHKKSMDEYSEETQGEFLENKKTNNRTRLQMELIRVFGKFNKKNLNTMQFIPYVNDAISRARKLDIHPEHRWPIKLGTRMYLLAEKII